MLFSEHLHRVQTHTHMIREHLKMTQNIPWQCMTPEITCIKHRTHTMVVLNSKMTPKNIKKYVIEHHSRLLSVLQHCCWQNLSLSVYNASLVNLQIRSKALNWTFLSVFCCILLLCHLCLSLLTLCQINSPVCSLTQDSREVNMTDTGCTISDGKSVAILQQ